MGAPLQISKLTREVQDSLREALQLQRVELEPRFQSVIGSFRGRSVRLAASVFTGSTVRYACFVSVAGEGVELAHVLCIPHARTGLPIFCADVFGLGGCDCVVAAADLSPVDRQAPVRYLPSHALPRGGALPAWASGCFSPCALVTRTRGCHAPAIARAVTGYAAAFVDAVREAHDTGRDFTPEQLAFCRAHREEDRAPGMLARIFGAEFSRAFIPAVLFPEALA